MPAPRRDLTLDTLRRHVAERCFAPSDRGLVGVEIELLTYPAAVCWLHRAPSSAMRQRTRSTFDIVSAIETAPLESLTPWGRRRRKRNQRNVNSPPLPDIPPQLPSILTNGRVSVSGPEV